MIDEVENFSHAYWIARDRFLYTKSFASVFYWVVCFFLDVEIFFFVPFKILDLINLLVICTGNVLFYLHHPLPVL